MCFVFKSDTFNYSLPRHEWIFRRTADSLCSIYITDLFPHSILLFFLPSLTPVIVVGFYVIFVKELFGRPNINLHQVRFLLHSYFQNTKVFPSIFFSGIHIKKFMSDKIQCLFLLPPKFRKGIFQINI